MENEFFGKEDMHGIRTSNKKYLAKKKRRKEKLATSERMAEEMDPLLFIQDDGKREKWRVAEIRQGSTRRIFECLSLQTNASTTVDLARNHPLFDQVVIGDRVSIEHEKIDGIIVRDNLLARFRGDQNRFSLHSRLLQPIAANLDAVVIVASAKDPAFQPGFIDRYMVLTEQSGISPIICITKSDLAPISDPILAWYEKQLGIPVVRTSAVSKEGIENLTEAIQGKTVAFVGKSGVGKSSLINLLLGGDVIRTSHVSEK
jgi:putative ribosome biogenesis GTPase RsgA